jgi:hypothetical protein
MENRPLRLAFGYQARVGKDTAAEFLIKRLSEQGHKCVIKSFSKAIYDIMYYAQKRCGFKEEKDRKFLQYIGTQWARDKDSNVWLNLVLKEIDELNPGTSVFVTDVRFPNEFDALEDRGFVMVNIRRDFSSLDLHPHQRNEISSSENFGNGSQLHESETALIPYTQKGRWHVTIFNKGTLEEFYSELDSVFILRSEMF